MPKKEDNKMAKISGKLIDGASQTIADAVIELRSLKNSSVVLNKAISTTTTKDGDYSIDAQVGKYEVVILRSGYSPAILGIIDICADSLDGSLNDYLLNPKEDEITSELLAQVTVLRNDSKKYAQQAKHSADSVDLSNTLKLTGGTLTGDLFINDKKVLIDGDVTQFNGGTVTGDTNFTARLQQGGNDILTQGMGGLYSKSPLLKAGTPLVASEVICVNQSFTLEGSYQYTPDDSRPWYGILNINRRLYDNNLAVVLTLYDGNKTYQRAGGDRGNGSWEWYDWKEDVTTDNIFNYQTGIGVGQKWHNVMSGRAWGVVYTNTTEKPIVVSLGMTSDSGDSVAVLYVDNIIVSVNTLYKQWSNAAQLSAIVPAGSIYYATQSNVNRRLQYWVELR